MRNIFYSLFAFALLFSCNEKEEPKTTVDLQYIEDFPTEIMVRVPDENYIFSIDTIMLNSAEDRVLEFDIKRPESIMVVKGTKAETFFIEPEGTLIAKNAEGEGLVFEGDTAEENSYLQSISFDKDLKKLAWKYDSSFDEFKKQVNDNFDYRKTLLDKYVSPDSYFAKYMDIDHRAFKNSAIINYIQYELPKEESAAAFEEYIDLGLADFDKVKPYLGGRLLSWYDRPYKDYLQQKEYGDQLSEITKKEGNYKLAAKTIAENYPSPIKESLLAETLEFYPMLYSGDYGYISPMELLKMYKDDLPEKTYNKQLAALEVRAKKEMKIVKGQPMPAFTFENTEGEPVEYLASSDKMTLIDVWASWCGPCIGSFPKMNKIAEKHKDQLRVISISLDDEFEDYKKGLANNDVPGEEKMHAPKAFQSEFAQFFMINAIPRYILVDADGNFLNSNLSDLSKIDEYLK